MRYEVPVAVWTHRICQPLSLFQVPGRLESQVYCDRALGTCSCLAHESVPKLKRVRHEGAEPAPAPESATSFRQRASGGACGWR